MFSLIYYMENMKHKVIQLISLAVLLVFVTTTAAVAADSPVKITLSAQKEVVSKDKNGKVTITYDKADKAGRDDVIVYTVVCENTGKEIIKQIELTDPIQAGAVVYIDGSATDGNKKVSLISFSIDKGKTYTIPSKLTYKTTDAKGKVVEKQATPDMYTNVKWLVDSLSPGEKVSVSFRAKVL